RRRELPDELPGMRLLRCADAPPSALWCVGDLDSGCAQLVADGVGGLEVLTGAGLAPLIEQRGDPPVDARAQRRLVAAGSLRRRELPDELPGMRLLRCADAPPSALWCVGDLDSGCAQLVADGVGGLEVLTGAGLAPLIEQRGDQPVDDRAQRRLVAAGSPPR